MGQKQSYMGPVRTVVASISYYDKGMHSNNNNFLKTRSVEVVLTDSNSDGIYQAWAAAFEVIANQKSSIHRVEIFKHPKDIEKIYSIEAIAEAIDEENITALQLIDRLDKTLASSLKQIVRAALEKKDSGIFQPNENVEVEMNFDAETSSKVFLMGKYMIHYKMLLESLQKEVGFKSTLVVTGY